MSKKIESPPRKTASRRPTTYLETMKATVLALKLKSVSPADFRKTLRIQLKNSAAKIKKASCKYLSGAEALGIQLKNSTAKMKKASCKSVSAVGPKKLPAAMKHPARGRPPGKRERRMEPSTVGADDEFCWKILKPYVHSPLKKYKDEEPTTEEEEEEEEKIGGDVVFPISDELRLTWEKYCRQQVHHLCKKGLAKFNSLNGTYFEFVRVEKANSLFCTVLYITFQAREPATRSLQSFQACAHHNFSEPAESLVHFCRIRRV